MICAFQTEEVRKRSFPYVVGISSRRNKVGFHDEAASLVRSVATREQFMQWWCKNV